MDYFYMNIKMEREVNNQREERNLSSQLRFNVALIFVWWNLFKDHKISQTLLKIVFELTCPRRTLLS